MSGKNQLQLLFPPILETAFLWSSLSYKCFNLFLALTNFELTVFLQLRSEQDIMEQEPQGDLLPEKLSIRQYLDEKLMPTLLPALNELAKEK